MMHIEQSIHLLVLWKAVAMASHSHSLCALVLLMRILPLFHTLQKCECEWVYASTVFFFFSNFCLKRKLAKFWIKISSTKSKDFHANEWMNYSRRILRIFRNIFAYWWDLALKCSLCARSQLRSAIFEIIECLTDRTLWSTQFIQ